MLSRRKLDVFFASLADHFVPAFYISMVLGIIFSLYFPQLTESFAKYGKSRNHEGSKSKSKSQIIMYLGNLTVPKSCFRHYYWFANFWNLFIFLLCELTDSKILRGNFLSFLVQIQVARRLYEVEKVQKLSSQAQMHVLHYFLGFGHYFCLAIVINSLHFDFVLTLFDSAVIITSLGLFIWSSYNQFKAHETLANLRNSTKMTYKIPTEGFFKTCSSPHYFFEILIYLSFVIFAKFQSYKLALMVIFVLSNLTTTAYFTHAWYLQTFPEKKDVLDLRHPILVFGLNSVFSKRDN